MKEHIENLMRLSERIAEMQTAQNNKFVSVFRINGQPIIPPLMTTEKRRQMEKLREKAMKLESFYEERRRQRALAEGISLDLVENNEVDNPLSSHTPSSNSLSGRSQKVFDEKQAADAQSYELLVSMVKNVELDTLNAKKKIMQQVQTADKVSRLNKLQKSQTLVYDNSTNEIIMPLNEYEDDLAMQPKQLNNNEQTNNSKEVSDEYEINNNENIVANDYLLNKSDDELCKNENSVEHCLSNIPSISINPPTPLVDERSLSEALSYAESIEDMLELDATVDLTNYTSSSSSVQVRIKGGSELTPIQCIPFECKNSYEPDYQSAVNETISMRRSATSPALKPTIKGQMAAMQLPRNAESGDNVDDIASITRSNSFTVESPSKALIEHMKQQEQTDLHSNHGKCGLSKSQLTYRTSSRQSTLTADTVESRAKRVSKSETKPKTKSSGKASNCGLPNLHQKLFKTKRSPYDSRLSKAASSTGGGNSRATKKQITAKSASTSPQNGHQKIKKPLHTPTPSPSFVSSYLSSNLGECENNNGQGNMLTVVANQVLGDIEAVHREKFLKLIAEQAAEQQRMQLAFEEQQRHLLEQLSRELTNAQIQVGNQSNETCIDTSATARSCSSVSTVSTVSLSSSILSPKNSRNNTTLVEDQALDTKNTSFKSAASNRDASYSPRRRLFGTENETSPASIASGDATYRTSSPSCPHN